MLIKIEGTYNTDVIEKTKRKKKVWLDEML